MDLNIILPTSTIFKENSDFHEGAENFLIECMNKDIQCVFISNSSEKLKTNSEILRMLLGSNPITFGRKEFRELLKTEEFKSTLKETVVIGANDVDLYMSANYKLLFLCPMWAEKKEDKALHYGFPINNFQILLSCLDIIRNQSQFYYSLEISSRTKLYALTSANNFGATSNEDTMISNFRDVLKEGSKEYFQPLFFHLISSIMKSDELRTIDLWGTMPSSSLLENKDMFEIKELCRYLTNRKQNKQLLIRHTKVKKSHQTSYEERLGKGASKHLESIMINPHYKGKLEGKTVCIMDDYITNGCSFEAVRNILEHEKVEKIIFFAFGRFKRGLKGVYLKEDYELNGNLYSNDYTHVLTNRDPNFGNHGEFDNRARTELSEIKNII